MITSLYDVEIYYETLWSAIYINMRLKIGSKKERKHEGTYFPLLSVVVLPQNRHSCNLSPPTLGATIGEILKRLSFIVLHSKPTKSSWGNIKVGAKKNLKTGELRLVDIFHLNLIKLERINGIEA